MKAYAAWPESWGLSVEILTMALDALNEAGIDPNAPLSLITEQISDGEGVTGQLRYVLHER